VFGTLNHRRPGRASRRGYLGLFTETEVRTKKGPANVMERVRGVTSRGSDRVVEDECSPPNRSTVYSRPTPVAHFVGIILFFCEYPYAPYLTQRRHVYVTVHFICLGGMDFLRLRRVVLQRPRPCYLCRTVFARLGDTTHTRTSTETRTRNGQEKEETKTTDASQRK
jgi:hypothetical protein